MSGSVKIVLTGGPCGGKTTLAGMLPCDAVIPEIASAVLRDGYRYGSPELQMEIYRRQLIAEERHGTKGIVILDRGTLDGAAYYGGIEKWCCLVRTTYERELSRYDIVIHLETSAYLSTYSCNTNPYRSEKPDVALKVDRKIGEVWSGHPRRHRFGGTLEEKKAAVLDIIGSVRQAQEMPH